MLNVFPGILIPFFAPLLLRVAVGVVFVCIGIRTWRRARELAAIPLPLIGAQAWMPYLAGVLEIALGLMFVAGWYTQVAALLGLVGMVKYAVYRRWCPRLIEGYFPISALAAVLIGAICVSLMFSGAGLHAFDIYL